MFVPFSVSGYFPPFMNALRSYTAKILLAVFIWAGTGLYLVRPVQAEASSNAFASWLKTVVKKGDTGNLRRQIYQLKESESSLNLLIRKASEMVSRYNDAFNLPLTDNTPDSGQVYNLLIVEWNSYQTGNGMGKAPVPKTVKSNLTPPADKFSHFYSPAVERTFYTGNYALTETGPVTPPSVSYKITPLSGGIAIGAP